MKKVATFLILLFSNFCFSQITLETFNKSFRSEPKITFIYFYTEWCGICKIQDKEIKSNTELNQTLNTAYYFIKIDGESKSDITFLEHDFKANDKQHTILNAFLKQNEIAFPNWIILNKNQEIIGKYSGLIKAKEFKKIFNQLKKEAN